MHPASARFAGAAVATAKSRDAALACLSDDHVHVILVDFRHRPGVPIGGQTALDHFRLGGRWVSAERVPQPERERVGAPAAWALFVLGPVFGEKLARAGAKSVGRAILRRDLLAPAPCMMFLDDVEALLAVNLIGEFARLPQCEGTADHRVV